MKQHGILIIYLIAITALLTHTYPFSWDSAEYYNNVENQWYTHPPGAPAFILLAQVIPLNLMPVLSSLGVLLFTFLIGKNIAKTTVPAYLLATTPLFILNYNWVETYMPSLCFIMTAVYCYIKSYEQETNISYFLMSALTFGIAIGVYPGAVFYSIFFIVYALVNKKPHGWLKPIKFLILSALVAFTAYQPIFYEVGGVVEGFKWIVNIVSEIAQESSSLTTLVKRAGVTILIFGFLTPILAVPSMRHKKLLPFTLTILPFMYFIKAATYHFYEHLLLLVPLLCILAGYTLRETPIKLKYLLVAGMIMGGLSTAYIIGSVYDYKDEFLETQMGMIKYTPVDSTIIELANYEHLNHLASKHHNIYALGNLAEFYTPQEIHNKKSYGTNNHLWTYNYSTVDEQLAVKDRAVFILNTAFIEEGTWEEFNKMYSLQEMFTATVEDPNPMLWDVIRKPVSMRTTDITMYRVRSYPYVYAYKTNCEFRLQGFLLQIDPHMTLFQDKPGCEIGLEINGVDYCLRRCITIEDYTDDSSLNLQCIPYNADLICKVKDGNEA